MEYLTPLLDERGSETPCVVDATVGMGGHASAILSYSNFCFLHAVDADAAMITYSKMRLASYENRVAFHNTWFDDFFVASAEQPHCQYNAILMDMGLCMYHFKASQRGFSRFGREPLDMRLHSARNAHTAAQVLNTYSREDLARIFFAYGEERAARLWAKKIVAWREHKPFVTTTDLLNALELGKKPSDGKTLVRIFQALRIEVNDELTRICRALPHAWQKLVSGGRLLVISFHSLEDRIIKRFSRMVSLKNEFKQSIYKSSDFFLQDAEKLWFDMDLDAGRNCTKKPIVPCEEEVRTYPESRSAKLRVIEKL